MIQRQLVIAVSVLLVAALALSTYAWHMRKTAVSTPVAPVDTRPLAPPVAGPTEQVTLFVAHDEDGSLHAESAQIPLPSGRQQRVEELLRTLVSHYLDKSSPHVLGPGSEIRSVFLVDPGVAVIDQRRLRRHSPLRGPRRRTDGGLAYPHHLRQHARHSKSEDSRRRQRPRHPRRPRRPLRLLRRKRSQSTSVATANRPVNASGPTWPYLATAKYSRHCNWQPGFRSDPASFLHLQLRH